MVWECMIGVSLSLEYNNNILKVVARWLGMYDGENTIIIFKVVARWFGNGSGYDRRESFVGILP